MEFSIGRLREWKPDFHIYSFTGGYIGCHYQIRDFCRKVKAKMSGNKITFTHASTLFKPGDIINFTLDINGKTKNRVVRKAINNEKLILWDPSISWLIITWCKVRRVFKSAWRMIKRKLKWHQE